MPEENARQRLDLDVGHRGALGLGEAADLRLREADVLQRCSSTSATQHLISGSASRKLGGSRPSNRAEYSRTAASPASAPPRSSESPSPRLTAAIRLAAPKQWLHTYVLMGVESTAT
jgi:hypothetical protein